MQPAHKPGANLSSNIQPASMIRAASISSHEATRPATPIHQNAFLSHIHHLFPHHALFHVKLHIHQISSVPLVRGEFGVRWKFRKVQASRSAGFLQKVKVKGKDRAIQASPEPSRPRDLSDDSDDDNDNDTNDGSQASHSAIVPAVVVTSDIHPTRSFSSNSSASASSALLDSSISMTSANTSVSHPDAHVKLGARRASDNQSISSAATRSPTRETMALDNTTEGYSAPRGMTAYLPLKEHGVTWEHTVDVVVQMAIDRDTRELQPSPLKLVVLQVRVWTFITAICLTMLLFSESYRAMLMLLAIPALARSILILPNTLAPAR
jgi:hypothetical protein